jgi:hypothetical protein
MRKLNIVVVGSIASEPYAGMTWMHMQILLGLQNLGHNTYYFEITSRWPYNPVLGSSENNSDYSLPYLKKILNSFGIEDNWAYRQSFSDKEWFGMSRSKAEDILQNADLVLNISGSSQFARENLKVGRLIYYGTDPVYPEIKFSQDDPKILRIINEHDEVVTYGENIGDPDCSIPPLPRLKARTRQPVLMNYWKSGEPTTRAFTTVGNWKQLGKDLNFKGDTYHWSKHYEYLKFIDLPKHTKQTLELATNLEGIAKLTTAGDTHDNAPSDDAGLLTSNGWKLINGPRLSMDPWTYRDYIINSRAEFSFAKDQNIRLKSGWFSERSACYLAAGRPVVTQDTGFGKKLPTGTGLFAFNNYEDILTSIDAINSNYEKHSKAAREIAEEYFRAEKVLDKLLEDLMT